MIKRLITFAVIFDKESGKAFMDTFLQLQEEAIRLKHADVAADSDEAQRFAKAYWDMITDSQAAI